MKLTRILARKVIQLVLTAVFLGTGSFAQSGNSASLRFTVPPAVATPIHFKTLPNAVCTLHPEGSQDAAHSLKLYADSEGKIHFDTRPHVESDAHVFFVVDCSAGGEVITHRIELRAASSPTPEMPAPPKAPKAAGLIRPALTTEQVNSLSNEELVTAHYPPKPDPKGAPLAYAAWLAAVSHPTTLIAPQTGQRSDIVPGPLATFQLTTPNWSGFATFPLHAATRFKAVQGLWQVPRLTGPPVCEVPTPGGVLPPGHPDVIAENQTTDNSSALWIGLDGALQSNLIQNEVVQAGTFQDVVDYLDITTGTCALWDLATYRVFTAWFPGQVNEYDFVKAGDVVFAEVWVELSHYYCPWHPVSPYNLSCPLKVLYPTLGHFQIENLTTGVATSASAPLPDGRTFSGSSAEWIMERPGTGTNPDGSCCAGYFDLATYNVAGMWSAYAQLTTGEWIPYDRDFVYQFTMTNDGTNGGKLLSSAERVPIIDPSSKAAAQSWIKFTWHDFK